MMKVFDLLSAECSALCRKDVVSPSPFRRIPVDQLDAFSVQSIVQELQTHAPTLLKIASVITTHNDRRNAEKQGSFHHPGICMAIATLLKERNREMCGLQSVISLALFNSQVQKKVCLCIYIVHIYTYKTYTS